MSITGVQHIQIYTADLSGSTEFYEKLGGKVIMRDSAVLPGRTISMAMVSLGDVRLELCERSEYAPPANGSLCPVGHFCVGVSDLDGFIARMKEKGIVFETETAARQTVWGGLKNIFLKGPSGERIELMEV